MTTVSFVIPGVSAYCDKGPPGARFSTMKPISETRNRSTMLCQKRSSR